MVGFKLFLVSLKPEQLRGMFVVTIMIFYKEVAIGGVSGIRDILKLTRSCILIKYENMRKKHLL